MRDFKMVLQPRCASPNPFTPVARRPSMRQIRTFTPGAPLHKTSLSHKRIPMKTISTQAPAGLRVRHDRPTQQPKADLAAPRSPPELDGQSLCNRLKHTGPTIHNVVP